MTNVQNFKILQIADNMWLLQILSKFVFFFWKLNKMRIVDKWL